MKVAIDISPLETGHKVRGTGFYLEYLKRSLLKYCPENRYVFFKSGQDIDNSVDLVHYPYFDPFFLTLPIIKNKKRVVTVHDLTPILYPQYFPSGLKGRARWLIQKYNLRKSDGIITDTFVSQRDIARITKLKKKRIDVAYLAAAEEFRQFARGKWRNEVVKKFSLPEKFVLYVGDITWNKNIPRLIEAVKEINLTLVMVGKAIADNNFDRANPWNKDIVKVHRMIEGDKRFIRLGFVSTQDLAAIYNIATVFVFPSIYEGFGLPILEAMQSGCPVVLSKEGAPKEIGGDAGFYVNPYNTSSIANGIGEVFFTPKLQGKLVERGLNQAKKFSWQTTAEETVKAYRKALSA